MSRKNLFLLIFVYLFVAHFVLFAAMSLYLNNDSSFFSTSGPYNEIARNVVKSGFYSEDGVNPAFTRPPLYPLFLSSMMLMFGDDYYSYGAVFFQILISVIIGLLVFLIAERIFDSRNIGLISVFLYSLHGMLLSKTFVRKELILFALFVVLFGYVLLKKEVSTKEVMLAAGFAALAALVRPTGVILFGVLMCFLLYTLLKNKVGFVFSIKRHFIPAVLVFLVIVSPWIIYSSVKLDKVLFTTSSIYGENFLKGHNPLNEVIYPFVDHDMLDVYIDKLVERRNITEEIEREDYLKSLAVEYIKDNPVTFLRMTGRKLFAFYSPLVTPFGRGEIVMKDGVVTLENFKFGSFNMVYTPFMIILYLGLVGYLVYSRRNLNAIVVILILLMTLGHILFTSETRHRLPLDPFLIVYAAAGFYYFFKKKIKSLTTDE